MVNRQIYATGSASADGAAQIQVPGRGRIVGVLWSARFNSITDGASFVFELSLQATSQTLTNDARGIVSIAQWESNFVTSGLSQGGLHFYAPASVQVEQGNILYLHAVAGGTVIYVVRALVWFM